MQLGLYLHGDSLIHRLPPGGKLGAMLSTGIVVFFIGEPWLLLGLLGLVGALAAIARLPGRALLQQLRPVVLLLLIILLVHALATDWTTGLVTVLRFAVVIGLALIITLTTRVSDLIEALETGLQPLARCGVDPARLSLMLALAIRLIPLLLEQLQAIREAQQARGLDRNLLALLAPLLIKTLRMADDLTDAIDARGYRLD